MGPTAGMQNWGSSSNSDPLFQYHFVGFVETHEEENKYSFFAETGYHVKGRTVRFRSGFNILTGNDIPTRRFNMKYNNLSLSLGVRNKFDIGNNKAYYLFALRGEYNLSTDFEIYPGLEPGVNDFVYGVTAGGGMEVPFGELVSGIIELRFSPDIGNQIFVPPASFNNPYTGRVDTFREMNIKNLALELSIGFRFLHKIVYVN